MKRVHAAASLPDAHILLGILREAGIAARIFNENAQGAVGEIPPTHAGPEVWVDDAADMERARTLIRAFEATPVEQGQRPCLDCGEEVPLQFAVCWSCGTAL